MRLTTDFEAGNGRITDRGGGRFRLEAVGDPYGYNRYFCLRIDNRDCPAATLHLEIHPDSGLGEGSNFISHFPSHLWYSAGDGWTRWTPLENTWPGSLRVMENHLEVTLQVAAGAVLMLASNPPLRWSGHARWVEELAARHEGRVRVESIGASREGREIPALRLGTPGRPRLLVLAGMHSSEHGGVYAARGIVDFLLSRLVEAQPVQAALDIAVIPMLNPDGNVHGFAGGTPQRLALNNSMDFQGLADAGAVPQYHENRLLWDWLRDRFPPDLSLHFHGYLGWRRGGDPPYDGVYALPEPGRLLRDPRRVDLHQAVLDRLRLQTPGYSAHFDVTGTLDDKSLEWQMARAFDTVGILYEVNCGSVGVSEQYRRGPQVLLALSRAALEDVPLTRGVPTPQSMNTP